MKHYRLPFGWMNDPVFRWNGKYPPQMAWLWIVETALTNDGMFGTSLSELANCWKWPRESVERFLQHMQTSKRIEMVPPGRTLKIIVLDLEKYELPEVDTDLFGQPIQEPTPEPDLQSAFNDWWSQYPKGRKGSKAATFPKYEKAIKSGATPQQLLDGVKRYKEAGYDGSRFVLGPQVWLNGRHWEDEDIPLASDTVKPAAETTTSNNALDRTSSARWRPIVKSWMEDGKWLPIHGLPPDRKGNQVPTEVLRELGITPH